MSFKTLAVAALAGAAHALDVQSVAVGMNPVNMAEGSKFWPDKITAAPGSMVQFQFWAGNHTVTQSNFDDACTPIVTTNGTAGIDSDFMPVAAGADTGEAPTFTIMVKDTKPMWLYCKPHCGVGMSMVINEDTSSNTTRSLDNYRNIASGTGSETPTTGTPDTGSGGSAPGTGSGSPDAGTPSSGTPTTGTPGSGIPAGGAADGAENTPGPTPGSDASSMSMSWSLLLAATAALALM